MPATPPGQDDPQGQRLSRGLEPVDAKEWVMLGLAALNVLFLYASGAYAVFLPELALRLVLPIDLAFLALFGLEFLGRLAKAERKVAFVRNHWYDVVGLVPITSVTFRAFRLVRLVRIYVIERLAWEPEPSWHQAFVRGVILRYRDVLLDEITEPIILAGIQVVKAPLRKARFASVVGKSLDNQRRQVHAVVRTTLQNTKGLKTVTKTKASDKLVTAITDAVLDTTVDTLKSDEMNELLANSIEDVMTSVARNVKGATVEATGGAARVDPPEAGQGDQAAEATAQPA